MRALIADDETTMRLVLRLKLETMGWVVDEASSGEEALGLAREAPYDTVVLDYLMPGHTGLDVGRELRREGYVGTILLYSAYLTPALEREALAAGLIPVSKTQFSELVERLQGAAEAAGQRASGGAPPFSSQDVV